MVSGMDTVAQNLRIWPYDQVPYSGNYKPIVQELDYDDIKGSPYLNETLMKGYAKFINGDSTFYFFRYNIYTDKMEYLKEDQMYVYENTSGTDYIYVDGHWFVNKSYKIRDEVKSGFLEVVATGWCNLYKQHVVDFVKMVPAQTPYHKDQPAHFSARKPNWFFSNSTQPLTLISIDSDGLMAVTGTDYEEVASYAKTQKLKVKKEEDFIELVQYLNKLRQKH